MNKNVVISCATVLSLAILVLAIADNSRPWKRHQLEFFELERHRLRSQLDAARVAVVETLADLEARIESQQAQLVDRHDEIVELEEDLKRFGGKRHAAELRRSRLESDLETALYVGETTAQGELKEALRQTRMEIESYGELIADRENKLAAVRSGLDQARENLARVRRPIEELEHSLAALPARPMLPLGGLLAPGIAVREISLPATLGAGDRRARVDRCVTCHLGAVGDDVADDRPVQFRRHPSPELFLSADSPHPYGRFGCITCHDGEGRATEFSRAGHTPVTSEQASSWRESRGWRPSSSDKMLPLDLTAAACGRCHGDDAVVAPDLEHGQRLIATLGCTDCHQSDRTRDPSPQVGPSLIGIAGKTSAAWAYRWLEAPKSLRRVTRMPHVLDHRSEPERSVEIRAMVDHLWQISRPAALEPPPAGDVERGRDLFDAVGCRGCHLLDPSSAEGADRQSSEPHEVRHGPHLAGIGSKVDDEWLYAWLREPKAYRHDTPMPSLRLDEGEAADLTAYLMTRRDPAWEELSLPASDVQTRDRLVLAELTRGHTIEQSQALFERMSDRERNAYLGERLIGRYGCHGCHQIAGFESTPAVGPALREVSDSLRGGMAAWAPETASWRASSHLPRYDLRDDEIRAVTVALLALAGDHPAAVSSDEERTVSLARGRRILERYNCRGCHLIEGRGGLEVHVVSPETSPQSSPPDLTHAGARLKATWIFEYLIDPGALQVRPWLDVRMPTFGLSEDEINALVRYFAVRDDRPLLTAEAPGPRSEIDIAVGRVVFEMLQCGECHVPASEESPMPQLAPAHEYASARLRPEWVVDLILDPESWLPGTVMPASFHPGETSHSSGPGEASDDEAELSSEFLIGSILTPIFAVERDRLLRLMGSEQDFHEYLSDPERVAAALRDYLWTLRK